MWFALGADSQPGETAAGRAPVWGIDSKQKSTMHSFITGSQAYGQPTEKSDIDFVVLVSESELDTLRRMADKVLEGRENSDADGEASSASLMFGRMNLIAVTNETDFAIWKHGTERLRQQKPVTRDMAIGVFRLLRAGGPLFDNAPTESLLS